MVWEKRFLDCECDKGYKLNVKISQINSVSYLFKSFSIIRTEFKTTVFCISYSNFNVLNKNKQNNSSLK